MRKRKYISEINITPFVDVMLVLLVIFLVTAPVVFSQIPVVLPQSQGRSTISNKKPVFITITEDARIYVQDTYIKDKTELASVLSAKGLVKNDAVYLRGDKRASYGSAIVLMNDLKNLHYQVSLVTEDV